jgi:hypothetical protein
LYETYNCRNAFDDYDHDYDYDYDLIYYARYGLRHTFSSLPGVWGRCRPRDCEGIVEAVFCGYDEYG